MWFTIADLAASKLLSGKTPTIQRAIRFRPADGPLPELEPVDLLGEVRVDPKERDFFQAIVEERKRAEASEGKDSPRAKGLKVFANATSYGIYAQMTRQTLPDRKRVPVRVYGSSDDSHIQDIATPGDGAEYTFPPIAAAITGGARLMLALLEARVTEAGGTYAFCDTDSMAIVATNEGELVPCPGGPHQGSDGEPAIHALPEKRIQAIREEFNQLNPYENGPGTDSILELEDENFTDAKTRTHRRQLYCYAISAKRYVLYNQDTHGTPDLRAFTTLDGAPDPDEPAAAIRKASEHGLGQFLNPTDLESNDRDWIAQTWQYILLSHLGRQASPPGWLDQPAVARTTISTPMLHKPFAALNRDPNGTTRPYAEQIKPFNFMNVAFVDKSERPHDEPRMVLVTPFQLDRNKWPTAPWTNRYSGLRYQLTDGPSLGRERPGLVRPKTLGDILADYLAHEEHKSLGPDKEPCEAQTAGLLSRRAVSARSITHIGKEANQLDNLLTGLVTDQDEILNTYDDGGETYFRNQIVPILRRIGVRETARRTDLVLALFMRC